MSLRLLAECDGCRSTISMGTNMSEVPEGWKTFNLNGATIHACSKDCADVAVGKAIAKFFIEERPRMRPAPRNG